MIDAEKRKAIYRLYREAMPLREICRRLRVGRNSVRRIIRQKGEMPPCERADKRHLDPELLRRLYHECQGYAQRVHEKLTQEEGIQVPYSTLTYRLRELGIRTPVKTRCDRVPDQPGEEMQHDTTRYRLKLGGNPLWLVASLIYLRYSKRRYLQFYRCFDRFRMKCFFHQALMFWGYAAGQCIIDNTNLARLRGIGKYAVIVPEMDAFAKSYGFGFVCHERGHANRKAGEERSFWTVETNFFPGRSFSSLEDLNQQALYWSTGLMDHRPQGKARLIPAQAFEFERLYLHQLPNHLPAPYRQHQRGTDQYGYVAFASNYYWVPGTGREPPTVLEYADSLKIFKGRQLLIEYPLPADGVKNTPFSPDGQPAPRYQPKNRKRPAIEEEKRLRAIGPSVGLYLDLILKTKGLQRHQFLRKLFALSRRMTPKLFIQTVQRAHKYRISDLSVLHRIALLLLAQEDTLLPNPDIDQAFQEREAYREGALTEQPDLSRYDPPPEEQDPNQPDHE